MAQLDTKLSPLRDIDISESTARQRVVLVEIAGVPTARVEVRWRALRVHQKHRSPAVATQVPAALKRHRMHT